MKKLLCLLLAVMMVLTLTACSKPASEAIIGTWVGELHINSDTLDLDGVDLDTTFPLLITFDEDGTVTIEPHEDLADETSEKLDAEFIKAATQMLYDTIGADSEDEANELCQEVYGMSVEEYAASAVEELNLYDTLAEAFEEDNEYDYEIDDDKLTIEIGGDEAELEIDGDKLIIDNADDEEAWEEAGFRFPIELVRYED